MASHPSARQVPPTSVGLANLLLLLSLPVATAQPLPTVDSSRAFAPAEFPPTATRTLDSTKSLPRLAGRAIYQIGEPTDEEQLYVELLNRARANPAAEAARYATTTHPSVLNAYTQFKVDLALMRSQFDAIAAAAPVSINAQLTEAARLHSQDMLANAFQGHDGTDGSNAGQRIQRAGYEWTAYGENVFSHARDPWFGHVGFDVDWGTGTGGMQTPPGHRNTIHSNAFREVGVGVVQGNNGDVGPQLVTQEFASRQGLTPFITGVVFYDFNGNEFYDLGEGVGGVRVRATATATESVTARSGGYSLPVAGNGTYTVTFEVPGLAEVARTVTVTDSANVKADHSPLYSAPVLGGSSVAYTGRDNPYLHSPVGAATAYQWRSLRRNPWVTPEGAEAGLGRFTAETSPGYNVIATDVHQAGNASFRLGHPQPAQPPLLPQYLTLTEPIQLGSASELSFQSRLGWAKPAQTARAQISLDDGASWEDLWAQAGTGTAGETGFTRRTASLGAYAGRTVLIRFAYTFEGGSYFPPTSPGVGWYLDEIAVSSAEELGEEAVATATGGAFAFRPATPGLYLLQVRALLGDRILSWGPALGLTAQDGGPVIPPRVQIDTLAAEAGSQRSLTFRLIEGTAAGYTVQTAASPTGPWGEAASTTIESTGTPGAFRARWPAGSELTQFYRVVAH